MKLATAIVLSSMLTACTFDTDESDAELANLGSSYIDDVEHVVIAPYGDPGQDRPGDLATTIVDDGVAERCEPDRNCVADSLPRFPHKPVSPSFAGSSGRIDASVAAALEVPDSSGESKLEPIDGLQDRLESTDDDDGKDDSRATPQPLSDEYPPLRLESEDDPCTLIDSTERLEQWIADHLGCNVCATFVCGDASSGACYMCQ